MDKINAALKNDQLTEEIRSICYGALLMAQTDDEFDTENAEHMTMLTALCSTVLEASDRVDFLGRAHTLSVAAKAGVANPRRESVVHIYNQLHAE